MITLRAKLVLLSMVASSPLGAGSVDFFGTVAATDQNLRPKGAQIFSERLAREAIEPLLRDRQCAASLIR